MNNIYDIIIIGAGPAGISASLYAKRSNMNVLVLYSGKSNLEKAEKIENYYGFKDIISGKDLFESGIKQAENLGVIVKNEEVLNIKNEEDFEIETNLNKYSCKVVIVGTGNKNLRPNIKGIEEYEGKGISYCAICDGFFYRDKNVVVIGNGKYAIKEANELKNIAKSVTILTNGLEMQEETDFEIKSLKIAEIVGNGKVNSIRFEDGSIIDVDGVFIAIGKASRNRFCKKDGCYNSGK